MNQKQQFQELLKRSKFLTVLTGAGISAESGIATFRGKGGLWRQYSAFELASPETWHRDPGLIWEFYNYRRQLMYDKNINPGHKAIAEIERRFRQADREFFLITQNIDDLHLRAGSQNVVRLHGSLWQVRCCECGNVKDNHRVPITPAFAGTGAPDLDSQISEFTREDLPKCEKDQGLLRPHVVWFGEALGEHDLAASYYAAQECDLFLVVGTSSTVYPAAGLAPLARQTGAKVAVVNLEVTPQNEESDFVFEGKAGEVLPELLDVEF